jgi:hypothetical protein
VAFKLTKAELDRKAEIESELTDAINKLDDGKRQLEEDMTNLVNKFNDDYVAPLNEALEKAYGFADDIANERQGEYDDKSDRWQEGDRGSAAYSWISAVESARDACDQLTFPDAPTFEFDAPDVSDFENMPEEMDA